MHVTVSHCPIWRDRELLRVETITAIVQEGKSQQSIPALAVGFTVGTFWDNSFTFASQ